MKVEVFYFEDCPNHGLAVQRVKEILKEESVAAEVIEVNVPDQATALALRFLGSPSVRIGGLDVEPAARSSRNYGLTCRTYLDKGKRQGLPSRDVIRAAIKEALARDPGANGCQASPRLTAHNPDRAGRSGLLLASSVVASVLASFCCILPILFALTGFTVIGASALFAEWRPFLVAATFGLLGFGFYFAYRPARGDCGPGGVCTMPAPKRSGRLMLWLATAAVILFAAFPYFSGPVAEFLLSQNNSAVAQTSQDLPTYNTPALQFMASIARLVPQPLRTS
ncbi:MAG: hypothetical protein L0387_12930 [Acidobacteria bacterium]|nr:hypothetical protein [Acidobacteriota bacterium]MCI0622542.1 hypothetical protein [Acidobacteriota bacterium]MCI0724330.1 hypothetical protein [Acidobacteriota bacterium]